MRWSWDRDADALFIYLADRRSARQVEMPDGVVVDLDADSTPVAIEVLSPNSGWDAEGVIARFPLAAEDQDALLTLRDSLGREAT